MQAIGKSYGPFFSDVWRSRTFSARSLIGLWARVLCLFFRPGLSRIPRRRAPATISRNVNS